MVFQSMEELITIRHYLFSFYISFAILTIFLIMRTKKARSEERAYESNFLRLSFV